MFKCCEYHKSHKLGEECSSSKILASWEQWKPPVSKKHSAQHSKLKLVPLRGYKKNQVLLVCANLLPEIKSLPCSFPSAFRPKTHLHLLLLNRLQTKGGAMKNVWWMTCSLMQPKVDCHPPPGEIAIGDFTFIHNRRRKSFGGKNCQMYNNLALDSSYSTLRSFGMHEIILPHLSWKQEIIKYLKLIAWQVARWEKKTVVFLS